MDTENKEIERKFLVEGDGWQQGDCTIIRQGYLNTDEERTVRVRTAGDQGYLTIKGITQGITRDEYEIPMEEANDMLESLCYKPLIEKRRYVVEHGGLTWEVDSFFGENEGLLIAEVELESEHQDFDKPSWIGQEVSDDARFFNASLLKNPFSTWKEKPEPLKPS